MCKMRTFSLFWRCSAFVTSVYNEDSYGGGGVVYYTAGLCRWQLISVETLAGESYAGSFGIMADFSDEGGAPNLRRRSRLFIKITKRLNYTLVSFVI